MSEQLNIILDDSELSKIVNEPNVNYALIALVIVFAIAIIYLYLTRNEND
jgi:hypothetical protein